MNRNLPPLPVRIVVALIVLSTIGYFAFRSLNNNESDQIKASGTIEAVTVNISPEMAGRVAEVLVEEGQSIKAGDPLLSLDSSLLTAQKAVASAAVDSANAALASAQLKYDQTLQTAISAQDAQRAKDLKTTAPSEFNQPNWYFNQSEQLAPAQLELDNAIEALDDANTNLEKVVTDLRDSDYLEAEQRLAEARAAFLTAQTVKDQADSAPDNGGFLEAANDYLELAQTELDDAQEEYDDLLDTDAAEDIEYARGQVLVAQQRYYAAYTRVLSLQTGVDSPAVVAAFQTLEQAKSAQAQAEANLTLLDTQMENLTIYAPMDGVVLTRNVEPGEFVQPGAVALTMGDLRHLTITVYVPETLVNEIQLGQQAMVTIDVASGESPTFNAEIIHIADQAEFTPRNVQTVEGRSGTVFAVKLKVTDTEGKLKIGMPADVVFK